jgi:hypothetical protein
MMGLVGSEMCIRDSLRLYHALVSPHSGVAGGELRLMVERRLGATIPVRRER